MFSFIRNLFKQPEPDTSSLNLSDLKEFFNQQSRDYTKDLNENIEKLKGKIALEIHNTRQNLKVLKNAELRNQNVPIKARQFLDGNRESYVRTVNNLIENISLGNSYDSLFSFSIDFDQKLEDFAKSTTKPYKILQEFLAHESREIALNIKNLDSFSKELKKAIEEKNLGKLKKLKDNILSIDSIKERKNSLLKELAEKQKLKKEKLELKEKLVNLHEEIKSSNEYTDMLSLKELKKRTAIQLDNIESNLFHSFSVINAALRKYARITLKDVDLLENYIDDPVNMLLKDEDLNILELLEGTRKNILNNSIELKDKKKDKTLDEINKLNEEFFKSFKASYSNTKQKMAELDEKISNNNSKAKLAELNEKLENVILSLQNLDGAISSLEQESKKINIENMKIELENQIKDVFGLGISIH
ncbi:MAG: hypothetical protein ABIJ08_02545 [Nanoarchaeota archaeon]